MRIRPNRAAFKVAGMDFEAIAGMYVRRGARMGMEMDNFMDKLAQRLNAQEMIKANYAAETEKMEKLQSQIEEYDACLQEMRKLNVKNVEISENVNRVIMESTEKLNELMESSLRKINDAQVRNEEYGEIKSGLEELNRLVMESREELGQITAAMESEADKTGALLKALEDNKKNTQELLAKTEEYVHTEDVKVYRNVQAVILEEAEKQTNAFRDSGKALEKKVKLALVLGGAAAAGALVEIGLTVAQILKLI